MKRLCRLFCAVLLCVLFAGCRQAPPAVSSAAPVSPTAPATPSDTGTVAIAFNREDTLNPFSTVTQSNLYLSTLLYDSLVRPDTTFSPELRLAGKVETPDQTHLTVTLRRSAVFSDGSAVTADDVIYAFGLAKASANYRAALSNIASVTGKSRTLTFTLSSPDPYAAACLYFPIVKKGTGDSALPVGGGAYVYQADSETLTLNPHAADLKNAANRTVRLQHLINDDAILQAFQSGTIQYLFNDLSDSNIPRTTAKDMAVDLPQLVFLGVNSHKAPLSSAGVRAALSAALDRTAIASSSYAGRALAALSPFHPNWKAAAGVSVFSPTVETDADQKLAAASSAATAASPAATAASPAATAASPAATAAPTGTTAPTSGGVTSASDGSTATVDDDDAAGSLTFTLIYPTGGTCREAAVKMLTRQLTHIGVTVQAVPLEYSAYLSRLSAGDYDLYLGEIRLTPNMNLQVFFKAGGAGVYGIDTAGNAATQYAAFRRGEITAADFAAAFGSDMPYIPLCWRQGMSACSAALSSYMKPSAYAVFDGITH